MKKIKELILKIEKRIQKFNLTKLIKSRGIIKDLENKIEELEKEKNKLHDKVIQLDFDVERLEELENKIPSMEIVIASSDKSLKDKINEIETLRNEKIKMMQELFELRMELASANIQKEEYEAQIKELKSDRYLVKKVRAGRTPNTNKTKISRPMSNNVVKFMRGEHE